MNQTRAPYEWKFKVKTQGSRIDISWVMDQKNACFLDGEYHVIEMPVYQALWEKYIKALAEIDALRAEPPKFPPPLTNDEMNSLKHPKKGSISVSSMVQASMNKQKRMKKESSDGES